MAKTKTKRTVGRRRKSGKKTSTSTRNKKRKNIIRGGMPIAAIVTALFAAAKLIKIGPADICKLDGTEPTNLCKLSYSDDDDQFQFIKALNLEQRDTLFDNVIKNKDRGLTDVEWGILKNIDWTKVNDINGLNIKYESDIKQKEEEHAAWSNNPLDKAVNRK